jgi:hypothetical protein
MGHSGSRRFESYSPGTLRISRIGLGAYYTLRGMDGIHVLQLDAL